MPLHTECKWSKFNPLPFTNSPSTRCRVLNIDEFRVHDLQLKTSPPLMVGNALNRPCLSQLANLHHSCKATSRQHMFSQYWRKPIHKKRFRRNTKVVEKSMKNVPESLTGYKATKLLCMIHHTTSGICSQSFRRPRSNSTARFRKKNSVLLVIWANS